MSGDLDIRGGGAVAVDTATLRSVAERFAALGLELDGIGVLLGSAGGRLMSGSHVVWSLTHAVEAVRVRVGAAHGTAARIAADLREAAAVYETIELRAERDIASSSGDVVTLLRIQRELAALAREYPDAADAAGREVARHWLRWPSELSTQAPGALWWVNPALFAMAGPSVWGMQRVIGAAGAGTIPRTARLRGPAPQVTVVPVQVRAPVPLPPLGASPPALVGPPSPIVSTSTSPATVAPPNLAGATARIPGGGESRIRVEKYVMADGTRQFAVYVAGTQSMVPRGSDPFDMTSNVQLYAGARSASYEATLSALAQSGARAGDVVHAFGHSQGAMIVSHLALESGYDTRTVVTLGSPVEADLGSETLSVALRHRDDPVAALAGGGHPAGVGAAGSFIAERTAYPTGGLQDWRLPAHGIEGYGVTAAMLDDSPDPRMTPVREMLATLAAAQSVEVVEYSAERTMPVSAPLAPGPAGAVSPSSADAG